MDRVIFGANWYVDKLNCWLSLAKLQAPKLEKNMEEVTLSGGWYELELPGPVKALQAPFELHGSHEKVRSLFGREAGDWTTFFYYERLRDLREGKNLGRIIRLKGLLNEVEQPEVTGKKADPTKYTIGSIVLYHDIVDGVTVHRFDFFANGLVIDGVNYTREHNRLLAI